MIKRGARSRQSTPRYEFPEHLGTLGDSTLQAVSRDREAAACLPVNDLTPLVGAVHGVAECLGPSEEKRCGSQSAHEVGMGKQNACTGAG